MELDLVWVFGLKLGLEPLDYFRGGDTQNIQNPLILGHVLCKLYSLNIVIVSSGQF